MILKHGNEKENSFKYKFIDKWNRQTKKSEEMKKEANDGWEKHKDKIRKSNQDVKKSWEELKQSVNNASREIQKQKNTCPKCGGTDWDNSATSQKKNIGLAGFGIRSFLFLPWGIFKAFTGKGTETTLIKVCKNCGYVKKEKVK